MTDVIAIAQSLPRFWDQVEGDDTRQRVVEALEAISEFFDMAGDAEAASLADEERRAVQRTLASEGVEAADPGDPRGADQAAYNIERLQAAVNKIIAWEIDRTLADLAVAKDGFPAEEIERIRTHRDLFIPRMLEACEAILGNLQEGEFGDDDGLVEMIALLLEFEVEQAFPLILRALTLPEDDVEAIFGDFTIPLLAHTLAIAVTRDKRYLIEIERIANLPEQGSFRPWGAINAYQYLLRDGTLSRQEVVDRLEQHLRVAIARGDRVHVSSLVYELHDYGAYEAKETIEEAFTKCLVDLMWIDQQRVENALEKGEAKWQEVVTRLEPTPLADAAEMLQQFFVYEPDDADLDDSLEDPWDDPWDDPWGEDESSTAVLRVPLDDWEEADEEGFASSPAPVESLRRDVARPGRNEPCPCGSGKKYKKCCLRK